MHAFGHEMLPQNHSGGDRLSNFFNSSSPVNPHQGSSAGDPLLEQAVSAVEDATDISPLAESQAELQAIIERLENATSQADVEEALLAVKDFASENTNESMIGTSIKQLADMADEVMAAVQSDPAGGSFAFNFDANFSSTTVQTGNSYKQNTSFSFSFSMQTDDTVMQANMSFSESFQKTDNGFKYESYENVNVKLATSNVNLETNPALDAFNKITEALTGIDLSGAFAPPPPPPAEELATTPVAKIGISEPYFPISPQELLQMSFEHLAIAQNSHKRLMMELSQYAKHHMAEIQATANA